MIWKNDIFFHFQSVNITGNWFTRTHHAKPRLFHMTSSLVHENGLHRPTGLFSAVLGPTLMIQIVSIVENVNHTKYQVDQMSL